MVIVVVALVAGGAAGLLGGAMAVVGYLGGLLTGAGMMVGLVYCVNGLLTPGEPGFGGKWPYVLLHVGKFGGAVLIAWLVVGVLGAGVASFAAGYLVALVGYLTLGVSDRSGCKRMG